MARKRRRAHAVVDESADRVPYIEKLELQGWTVGGPRKPDPRDIGDAHRLDLRQFALVVEISGEDSRLIVGEPVDLVEWIERNRPEFAVEGVPNPPRAGVFQYQKFKRLCDPGEQEFWWSLCATLSGPPKVARKLEV